MSVMRYQLHMCAKFGQGVTAPWTSEMAIVCDTGISVTWMYSPWPTLHTCEAGNSITDILGLFVYVMLVLSVTWMYFLCTHVRLVAPLTSWPIHYVTLILSVPWICSPWLTLHTCGAGNSITNILPVHYVMLVLGITI